MNEQTTQAYIAPSVGRHKLESEIARLEAENAKLTNIVSNMVDRMWHRIPGDIKEMIVETLDHLGGES